MSEMDQILAKSRAAEPFKRAVRSYSSSGGGDHIRVDGFAPSIKVKRLLAHMLAAEPHLPIERISLRGRSGCSDFVGTVKVHTASETRVYEFVWDCRWRAEQEGWTDCFGFPASLPSILAHAGLKGFSTQKLTWNSAAPVGGRLVYTQKASMWTFRISYGPAA